MAQRGHAQDCPGCEWESYCLQPEDAAWTGKPPAHRRQPPPVRPKPHANAWFAAIWIATVIPGLALPVLWLKLLGLAVFLLSVGFWLVHEISHERRYRGCHWCTERAAREWPELWATWLAEQLQAWETRRLEDCVWPCPRCGDLECVDHISALHRWHWTTKKSPSPPPVRAMKRG